MASTRPIWGQVYDVPENTTGDDLLRLPDDGSRYELFHGKLVREMTSPEHGAICQRLGVALGIYAQQTGFPNRIVQNALFDLTPSTQPDPAHRVALAPDLAIRRLGAPVSWNVPHEAPLVTVEVASPSQTPAEMSVKAQTYLEAGVEEVWAVDPRTRTVEVWTTQGTTTFDDTQPLTSALLPGFSVAVRSLFDG